VTAPTSISDTADYRAICARAAGDDAAFAQFRRLDAFLAIVEPPSRAGGGDRVDSAIDGQEFAGHVRAIAPYRPLLDAFRASDRIGAPVVEAFDELGTFNSYTLRYIKILWDLERLFGSLDGLRILEIGGGYGGQCAIVARRFRFAAYDILDLPETGALARRFLDEAGIGSVRCLSETAALAPSYDLLLSNYAFSELSDALRESYRDAIVPRCARGFMLWNRMSLAVAQFNQSQLEAVGDFRDEMLRLFSKVSKPRIVDEFLTLDDRKRGNLIVAWG
jgi:hypothetical protein